MADYQTIGSPLPPEGKSEEIYCSFCGNKHFDYENIYLKSTFENIGVYCALNLTIQDLKERYVDSEPEEIKSTVQEMIDGINEYKKYYI